ncbi:MAG TPA: nickel-binding protein [Terriglobales bacterium]|nr:nickel-binding protein [Terriglobales bacterium]
MPTFIDRHSVAKGTRLGDILAIHDKDLAVEDKHQCKGRTFWMDEERGFVTCLIDAPTKDSVIAMHAEAHGDLPTDIMEVSPELVMAFLGRLDDLPEVPAHSRDHSTSFRTVMFTDLKDSTAITSRLGDVKAMEILRVHDRMIQNAVDAFHGRVVKHTGDGLMVSFPHAPDAVGCAIAIQRAFAEYNEAKPAVELHVRVGLAAGEPVTAGQDLFGSTVQKAARICAHAQPDQTLVDDTVYELCPAWHPMMETAGEANIKGFQETQRVYEIDWRVGAASS